MFYHLFSPAQSEALRVLGASENRHYFEHFPGQSVVQQEEDNAWTIKMVVPGIKREQLELSVVQDQNTFLAIKIKASDTQNERLLQRFHLHKGLNIEEIEAQLEDGILRIRIAKKEAVKKLIDIA